MTETELELSFPAVDAELQAFIEETLRERDGITVGRIRHVRAIDPLTVFEIAGTVVGLADALCDLRDRVKTYLQKRGKNDQVLGVANADGAQAPLLAATDDEVKAIVTASSRSPEPESEA
jgi:hypothetical protein